MADLSDIGSLAKALRHNLPRDNGERELYRLRDEMKKQIETMQGRLSGVELAIKLLEAPADG